MQPVPSPASLPQQGQHAATQHAATQHGSVDAARSRLAGIEQLSTLEQVDAFDAVHRLLQDSLASVEQELRAEVPQGTAGASQPAGQQPGGHNNGQHGNQHSGQNRHGKNRHGRR